MSEINIDYIGVVVENPDGFLEYKKIPIEKPYNELYEELKAMADNENRSVLDLQNRLERSFDREYRNKFYHYCHRYTYNSSFIEAISYPKFWTYEEYTDLLSKSDTFKKELKQIFIRSANYFFIAYSYSQMFKRLKNEPANKMFSTEDIGHTFYKYKINENIEFQIRSNFGYGGSSFFFVNLTYQGIELLPYSDIVKYYKANMCDFIRYTRQYLPERKNWNYALNFVVETSNYAIKDESAFIEKWIFNEIEEMMLGLERLAINPKEEYHKISNNNFDTPELITVRNIGNDEIKKYKIYPTETVIAFQAEKITGALILLEQIGKLSSVYVNAERVIDRIKKINSELLPQYKKAISSIDEKIAPLQVNIETLTEKENTLIEICKPFEEEFEAILNKAREEAKAKDHNIWINPANLKPKYLFDHPEYKEYLDKITEIKHEIKLLTDNINELKDFIKQLTKCIELIDMHILAA